jgi:hypothetical protein
MDSSMQTLIDKLHHGDPVRGWEGDPRLAVYWNPPHWEVMRLEHDGQYRMVCRSGPNVPFDERLIDALVAHDRQRGYQLHGGVVDNNERIKARHRAALDEQLAEDVGPRLRHALRSEL